MSHEAAKQEHLKETIQDRSPREESVSRQPTNQLLLLGGRRKKGGKKKLCKDKQMTEGAHRGRWLTRSRSRSRRRGRGEEEVGGTGKVGEEGLRGDHNLHNFLQRWRRRSEKRRKRTRRDGWRRGRRRYGD